MIVDIIVIIIGFILLIKGADFLINGSVELAKRFNISEMLIGIVIIGIGTSMPEIIITIKSAINNSSDLIIGNAIGSSICNTLLVIGTASIFHPLILDKRIEKVHIPLSLLSIIILYLVGNYYIFDIQYMQISIKESIFMLSIVLLYIIYTIFEGKKEDLDVEKELEKYETKIGKKTGIFKIIFDLTLGIIFLNFGADFVVNNAKSIAQALQVNEAIISLTIVALGTALPEIVTSIIASLRGDYNLAMGNIIGSNLYNLLLLPGIGGVMSGGMEFSPLFNSQLIVLIASIVFLIISNYVGKKNEISRKTGFILILAYIIYSVRIFFK